jgi:hypothetical protein
MLSFFTKPVHPKQDAILRTDGPTLEEFVGRGYKAENYPPTGYAVRINPPPPPPTVEGDCDICRKPKSQANEGCCVCDPKVAPHRR